MKPHTLIIPIAVLCAMGTGYHAFVDNNAKSSVANAHLMAKAGTIEAKEAAEEQRSKNLRVIADEALNGKPALVVFDTKRRLIRVQVAPDQVAPDQYFKPGMTVPDSFHNSSVGVFNLITGEYAAIGVLDRKLQILNVYTREEVQKSLNR